MEICEAFNLDDIIVSFTIKKNKKTFIQKKILILKSLSWFQNKLATDISYVEKIFQIKDINLEMYRIEQQSII